MALQFDYQHPTYIPLGELLPQIGDGWLAQYRGRSYIGQLIQLVGGSVPHTHSALLTRHPSGAVDVLELREFIGGRIDPIEAHAEWSKGCIDLFAPDTKRWPEFDGAGAVAFMRRLVAQPYNYRGIVSVALRHMPVLWRFFRIDTRDKVHGKAGAKGAAFCSQAVSIACALGGGVDPCPRRPHWMTQPSDLTGSMFWQYRGSIK